MIDGHRHDQYVTVEDPRVNDRFNVKAYGARGDGTTDDTAAIQAAISAAINAGGGAVVLPPGVYACTSSLNADGAKNVSIEGTAPVRAIRGYASNPKTDLKFTGSGTGTFLSARQSYGFTIKKLNISYSSASFTGTLVDVGKNADLSYFPAFIDCHLTGTAAAMGAVLVDMCNVVEASVTRCVFEFGSIGIRGKRTAGNYCNALRVTDTRFANLGTTCISEPGTGLMVSGCVFEPLYGGAGVSAIQGSITGWQENATIIGSGFWDSVGVTGSWIELNWNNLNVHSCYFELDTGVTAVKMTGSNTGISLIGNYVHKYSGGTWFDPASSTQVFEVGNRIPSGVTGTYTVTTVAWSPVVSSNYRLRVQNITASTSGVGTDGLVLADATSAAVVYTLPDAAAVGVGSRQLVKKKDASANTVTVTRLNGYENIEGAGSWVLSNQFDFVELISDGASTWYVLSRNP